VERVKTATHFSAFPRKRVGLGRKRATTMNRARSTPLRPATRARSMQPWTPACHTEQAMSFFSVSRKT
jgi:hypothetical protein